MDLILRGYQVNDPTWLYLSFLLIVAVYFKFSRLWSVRNLDLLLLLGISPGLLMVREGNEPSVVAYGYVWLFVVSALLLVRVLFDGSIVRRPRLEQNMNAAGMTFLCAATFLFLTTKLLTELPPPSTVESIRKANELIEGNKTADREPLAQREATPDIASAGPAASLVAVPVSGLSKVVVQGETGHVPSATDVEVVTARLIAILAHLAVIVGLALVGRHAFGDNDLGFAMATLYMLLPCTAFDVGKINHVLPAACLVWAIWAWRRPFVSGTLLGLSCAMMFFPIFLLPLWVAFYGRRGGIRFCLAVGMTAAVIVSSLVLLSKNSDVSVQQFLGYVNWRDLPVFVTGQNRGFWSEHESAFRIPVFVAYIVMLIGLTLWPARKSLAQVITHSAAIVIGTQFWYPQQGGVYILWYLPLLLLVLFRPTMTNHVAPDLKPIDLLAILGLRERRQPELATTTAETP